MNNQNGFILKPAILTLLFGLPFIFVKHLFSFWWVWRCPRSTNDALHFVHLNELSTWWDRTWLARWARLVDRWLQMVHWKYLKKKCRFMCFDSSLPRIRWPHSWHPCVFGSFFVWTRHSWPAFRRFAELSRTILTLVSLDIFMWFHVSIQCGEMIKLPRANSTDKLS